MLPAAALLCRLAALGTSLQLKAQFGVGYTLTLSRQPVGSSGDSSGENSSGNGSIGPTEASLAGADGQTGGAVHVAAAGDSNTDAGAAALTAAVEQFVPGAQLLSVTGVHVGVQECRSLAAGHAPWLFVARLASPYTTRPSCTQSPAACAAGEAAYRLPKEVASAFPPLLRQLEQDGAQLGVGAYGLSETTLEEVFLRVSESAATPQDVTEPAAARRPSGSKQQSAVAEAGSTAGAAPAVGEGVGGDRSEFVVVSLPRSSYLKASSGRGWWEALAEWMQLGAGVLLAVITNTGILSCAAKLYLPYPTSACRAGRCGGSSCVPCWRSARCARCAMPGRRWCRWGVLAQRRVVHKLLQQPPKVISMLQHTARIMPAAFSNKGTSLALPACSTAGCGACSAGAAGAVGRPRLGSLPAAATPAPGQARLCWGGRGGQNLGVGSAPGLHAACLK